MRHKRLPWGVYDTEIHALCGKRDELNRYLRRTCNTKEDEIGEGACGHYTTWIPDNPKLYTRRYICVLSDGTYKKERRHVLLHECVHCALSVFDDKHVKYDGNNDEHLAYFIEWLYAESESVLM